MQHFLNLDKCGCGAYRYLAAREHKRSYEIYLIHHFHAHGSQPTRRYAKLASIPKYRLNIHDERVSEKREKKEVKLTFEELLNLRTILKQLDLTSSTSNEELSIEYKERSFIEDSEINDNLPPEEENPISA